MAQGMVGIVNLTTRNPPCDDSCVITEGEHPFVEHESIIHYRQGQLVEDQVLEDAKQHGYIEMRQPFSRGLLRRVQEGALASRYTQQGIQEAVRSTLAITGGNAN